MRENTLKQKLYAGQAAFGVMCTFPSPPVVEMLGQGGRAAAVVDVDEGRARPRGTLDDDHRYVARHQVVVRRPGLATAVVVDHRVEGHPAVLVADATRARQELGWNPVYFDLDNIISHAWQWEYASSQYAMQAVQGSVFR